MLWRWLLHQSISWGGPLTSARPSGESRGSSDGALTVVLPGGWKVDRTDGGPS